jgi:radical SAM superfamily enzyme YgiQ (UPF0313 family)
MKNLVISVPRLEIHRPPISTAIVAETIRLAGQEVEAMDLNCDFFHYLPDRQTYYNYDEIWDKNRAPTLSEAKNIVKFIKSKFKHMDKYDWYWISVFGGSATLFTSMLCKLIRKHLKNKFIILGGQGVQEMNIIGKNNIFGETMKSSGLCDLYLAGEGELIIKHVLRGETSGPGINNINSVQINELDTLPYPNYSFYDLDKYDYLQKDKEVFIVGSRGCVRRCTYCDVARYWPKFRYRSGKNIAMEMINHYEKHGVNRFYFTDSLINGSMKAFNDMCDVLAKYNTDHEAGFEWKGQFIFRPKNQLPNDHFATVAAAGGKEFYVGVETGSDKIRWEMDKKFTNEDIDYQLEEFNRHGITVFFLMLIGYVTETHEDHHETLRMFKRWQKYVATGTIKGIDLGVGLKFLSNTPLEKQIDQHEVYFLKGDLSLSETQQTDLWQAKSNPDLDVPERIRRRIETHEEAIRYNWPIWRGEQRLNGVKLMTEKYLRFIQDQPEEPKKITLENLNFFE